MCVKDTEISGSTEPWCVTEEQPDPKQHLSHPTQPTVKATEVCGVSKKDKMCILQIQI